MRYYPILNPWTGSVNGTLFLLQALYWFEKEKEPFYKFQKPSSHILYKPGDSWTEELGLTNSQFKSVLKAVGTKLKRGEQYDLLHCQLVLYWNSGNGIHFYCPNYPALLKTGEASLFLERKFLYFEKWKSHFPNVSNQQFQVIFSSPLKFNPATSFIHRNTQPTTNNNSDKDSSFFEKNKNDTVFPFETMEFKKTWSAWKEYKLEKFGFQYSEKSEQAALIPLSNYSEKFSIQIIQKSIANGWKDFHFEDTPNKYLKYRNSQEHAKYSSSNGIKVEPKVDAVLKKYST